MQQGYIPHDFLQEECFYSATPSELTKSTVARLGPLYTQTEEIVLMKPTWVSTTPEYEQSELTQSVKYSGAPPSQVSSVVQNDFTDFLLEVHYLLLACQEEELNWVCMHHLENIPGSTVRMLCLDLQLK